ncbi:hypothetical protein KAR91_85130 [Candidatus Pacearchaeota archaeon]|nr:hypothetical protein [Candidatus Pacearchaeota archaeon]
MTEFKKGDKVIVESVHVPDYEATVKMVGHQLRKKGKLLVTVAGGAARWVDVKKCRLKS